MKEPRIETQELIVHDENGRPRFVLSAKDNAPRFHMYAEDGSLVASLSVANDMPVLQLMDKSAKCILSVAIAPDGSMSFVAQSKEHTSSISAGVTDGVPNMVLRDKEENSLVISVAGMSNPDLERR